MGKIILDKNWIRNAQIGGLVGVKVIGKGSETGHRADVETLVERHVFVVDVGRHEREDVELLDDDRSTVGGDGDRIGVGGDAGFKRRTRFEATSLPEVSDEHDGKEDESDDSERQDDDQDDHKNVFGDQWWSGGLKEKVIEDRRI